MIKTPLNKVKLLLINYIKKIYSRATKVTLKQIDSEKNIAYIHIPCSHNLIIININKIIFDRSIIENMDSSDAAKLGFEFGKNKFSQLKNSSSFTVATNSKYKCNLISIDRFKNIQFSFTEINDNNYLSLAPSSLIQSNKYLQHFPPLQACYIGILAGKQSVNINKNNSALVFDISK